jgi:hypothetical protein
MASSSRSSRSSQINQYSLSSTEEHADSNSRIAVQGTDINVFAVQDAGRYRIILDDFMYLLSSIESESVSIAEAALWELASLLSRKQNRSILWSCTSDAPLSSILNLVGSIPDDLRNRKLATETNHDSDDAVSCTRWTVIRYEALAVIIHFLSLDCTVSSLSTNTSNTSSARKFRQSILQHPPALLGMSHMILMSVLNSFGDVTALQSHKEQLIDSKYPSLRSSVSSSSESMFSGLSSIDNTENTNGGVQLKSKDPTMSGRRNRRRLRQITQAIQPSENDNDYVAASSGDDYNRKPSDINESSSTSDERLSFLSAEQSFNRSSEMNHDRLLSIIQDVKSRLFRQGDTSKFVDKHESHNLDSIPSFSLESLLRIIQGKNEGEDASCFDGEDESDGHYPESISNDASEDLEALNPIIMTNKALLQSGSLGVLAMGMAEILNVAMCSTSISQSFVKQVSMVATLIDGACLHFAENRDELCGSDAFAFSLLKFLSISSFDDESAVLEVVLICMRMLTSLTHESRIACDMLLQVNDDCDVLSKQSKMYGIEIIIQLLYRNCNSCTKQAAQNTEAFRQAYDINIFCLNTLTNVVETARSPRLLTELKVTSQSTFLSWFLIWIVQETESFREQAMAGKFGNSKSSSSSQHNNDQEQCCLPEEADEHLVTAGNGFILLACILVHGDDKLRESILSELGSEGFTLMIHTLKSFCNFYYFSLGDLSVAVISPVKKLLQDLESLGQKRKDILNEEVTKI